MRTWGLVGIALATGIVFACGTDSTEQSGPDAGIGPECAPGTTQGCSCTNGLSGVKTCGADSRWGGCSCSPSAPPSPIEQDSGADAGCTIGHYYADNDHDGFGAGPLIDVCEPVAPDAGWVLLAGDCDDADERAFPGQALPQEGLRKGVGGGDFNCDNVETKSLTKLGGCACPGWAEGWTSNAPPPCGGEDSWMDFCSAVSQTICNQTVITQKQKCL